MTDLEGAPTVVTSARTVDVEMGGNSTYVRNVLARLPNFGVRVALARPRRAGSARWAAFEGLRMQRIASRHNATTAWYPNDTGPLARSPQVSTVVTIHGAAALHGFGPRDPRATAIWLKRAQWAGRRADRIITVSNASADDIVSVCGEQVAERITVIPHGVDLERYQPAPSDEIERVRTAYAIHGDYIVYLGNVEPRKNLCALVDAVETLVASGHRTQLVIAGRPLYDARPIIDAIEASGSATRIGWVPGEDVAPLISGATTFAFPSLYEGFGLPVLEAMACGTPVACSRRGSLPEVGGEVATYSDVTADSIAASLLESASKNRASVSRLGIERARGFRWDDSARTHARVLTHAATS